MSTPVEALPSRYEECKKAVQEWVTPVLTHLIADYAVFPFRGWRWRKVYSVPDPIGDAVFTDPETCHCFCPSTQVVHTLTPQRLSSRKVESNVLFEQRIDHLICYLQKGSSEEYALASWSVHAHRVAKGIEHGNFFLAKHGESYFFDVVAHEGCVPWRELRGDMRMSYDPTLLCPTTIAPWNINDIVVISGGEIVWLDFFKKTPMVPPLRSEMQWTSICVHHNKLYASSGCNVYALELQ